MVDVATDLTTSTLERRIGLIGAVSILTGFIIGATIFILPGPLAGDAGPSIILAMSVASVPALFIGVYNAQLGSALPTSGGNYVYVSRLISPALGFLSVWLLILATFTGTALVASGFGEYLAVFFDVPIVAANVLLVLGFLLLNVVGVKVMERVQILMVALFVLALLAFIVPGIFHVESGNHDPLFPNGFDPFLLAVISFYFSYIGVTVVTEIGEEITNPKRNIPLTIGISIALIAGLYTLLVFVLTGVVHWEELGEMDAAVATASEQFLPPWGTAFIAFGALVAIGTTVNAILATFSRTILQAGRDLAFPGVFGEINGRFGTPVNALILLGLPAAFVVGLNLSITFISTVTVLGILTINVFVAIALWRLPKRYPGQYSAAGFKLGERTIKLVAIVGGLVTLVFLLLGATESFEAGIVTAAWIAIGLVTYAVRRRQLSERGVDLTERLSTLPETVRE